MRFLVKVGIPTDIGNERFKDGTFVPTLQSILADLKPEAAYFVEENGERTGYVIVNIEEPSQIPAVAEPFFQAFAASVEFHPAMLADDLMKAGPAINQAAKKYG